VKVARWVWIAVVCALCLTPVFIEIVWGLN
jgi:hypothetical protein